MTKMHVVELQCRLLDKENSATSPAMRKYWSNHFKRLTKLARSIGWID